MEWSDLHLHPTRRELHPRGRDGSHALRRRRVGATALALVTFSAALLLPDETRAQFQGKLPANTVVGNNTGATADARALVMPSCADGSNRHLNWVAASGFSCGTSGPTVPASTSVVYSDGTSLLGDATNFSWTAATRQLAIIANTGGGGDLNHRYGLSVTGGDANATGAIQGGMSASTSRFAIGTLDTAPTPHTYLKGFTSAYAVEPVALNPAGGQVLTGTSAYNLYTGSFVTKNVVGGSKFVQQAVTQGGGSMGGIYEDGSGNAELHLCASGAACNSDGTVTAKVRSAGLSYFPQVAVKDTLSCAGSQALNTNSSGQISCGTVTSGGGGTGGLWNQVISATPTSASTGLTTWGQQNGATVADGATGVVITGSVVATDLTIRYKAAPATPYTITALIATDTTDVAAAFGALFGWYDGTKIQVIALYNRSGGAVGSPGQILVLDYATLTSAAAAANVRFTGTTNLTRAWFSISDDGTNVTFKYLPEGNAAAAVTLYTVAKASGYLSAYSNVLVGVSRRGASSQTTILSWTQS